MVVPVTFAGKTVMSKSFYYNKRLDLILETFVENESGFITKRNLFDNAPKDFPDALSFLVAEGCLEEDDYYFKITYKGKALINQGGFVGKYRRERTLFYFSVIGTITGVIGLIVSIVALNG